MTIDKYHNQQYSGNVPSRVGDRRYSQDRVRDFWFQMDKLGLSFDDIMGLLPILLSGGVVTQGAGSSLDITAGYGYAKFNVEIPDSFASTPPTKTTGDIEAMRVSWGAQNDINASSANCSVYTVVDDGATVQYVKMRYLETDGNTRNRAKSTGSYAYEVTPDFDLQVDAVAPTDYDILLATFTSSGGTYTITASTTQVLQFPTVADLNTALIQIEKRQTVLSAKTDSDGYADFLSESSGQITLDTNSGSDPAYLTWAKGFDARGAIDLLSVIESDQSPAGWDLSSEDDGDWYLYIDNDGSGNLTYGATKKAPHYGVNYPNDLNALLHFEGANGSTTFTDEYGNDWEALNDAQISTSESKFGSSSVRFDGGNDAVQATNFCNNHPDAFTIEMWVNEDNLSATRYFQACRSIYGVQTSIDTAGQLKLFASSNGSSNDIINGTASTGSPTVSAATWHHLCVEWDGSTLRTYIDGSIKHSVSTSFLVNNGGSNDLEDRSSRIGLNYASDGDMLGYIDELRITHGWARYGQAFTAPTEAFTPDTDFNWFDISKMQMYVGNPTTSWTATNRLFVGQVNKSGSSYTVTNYAIKGIYVTPIIDGEVGSTYNYNHNIGTTIVENRGFFRANSGCHWSSLQKVYIGGTYNGSTIETTKNKLTVDFDTTSADNFGGPNAYGNFSFPVATNNGEVQIIIERGF